MLAVGAPNKIAASPVPVIWLQLPVTEGIFNDEITKIKAPDIAKSIKARLFSVIMPLIRRRPMIKNGMQSAAQAMQYSRGK
jgi:hypothetical protein